MSDKSGRNCSQESDSSSNVSVYQPTDVNNMYNGSFDEVPVPVYGNFNMFDFMNFGAQNNAIYSPKTFVKSNDTCRLTAAIHTPKRDATYSTSLEFREVSDRLPDLSFNEESFYNITANNSSFVGNFSSFSNVRSIRLLPTWAVDTNGNIREDLSLMEVIQNGSLIDFAMDRTGVKFLEKNYPEDAGNEIHQMLFDKLTEQKSVFLGLCRSAAGNFIIQKFVDYASIDEQNRLVETIKESGLFQMCLDKFACRVVQLAVQKFDVSVSTKLVEDISNLDLMPLCTDQCAIHVIQKIVKSMPITTWSFFVKFLCRDDNLMNVCQDKYGCRLVQQTIDKLSDNPKASCFNSRLQLLHGLMTSVARNCFRLASNEFANYVVQYVIKSSGIMEMYRDTIIDKCLLRNLLSMSQDKYASHVVEGAFLFAPSNLLSEMMDEIFEGYVKDQETNRDALDILLFHQYGNYVVQQMISICISALLGSKERKLTSNEMRMYSIWFERIKARVIKHSSRLERFSSGKKIIESIQKITVPAPFPFIPQPLDSEPMPLWNFPTPLMDVTNRLMNNHSTQLHNHSSVFDD